MTKPKIALIVDTDNWAFYNRAIFLKERLSEYFEFKIIPATTALQENVLQVILLVQDCDLVHFFWRGLLFSLSNDNIVFKRNQINVDDFINEKFSKIIKTTCVPDHALLDKENIENSKRVLNLVDDYYVMSQKLFKIYNELDCRKPYGVITGGANTKLFTPQRLERFENMENRTIVIGWSGNSKWGNWDRKSGEDIKGVDTILIPAVEQLQKEGYNIELKLADRNIKYTPIEEMKDFYNSIDLYVCTSKEEGGPNTILESMCCGIPIISTNVGFVEEVLGEKQSQYIIQERSIENVKNKIKELMNNKDKFKELSKENLTEIQQYSYDAIAEQFKQFFEKNLKKRGNKDGQREY